MSMAARLLASTAHRFGRSTLGGSLLRLPLALVPKTAVVPVFGGPLRGLRWIVGSTSHGAWLGTYEHSKLLSFSSFIQERMTVWDIGANVGIYTLLSSLLVGPSGKVIAFEPLPINLRYLREHVRLNSLHNVTVCAAAVSSRSGTVCFSPGLTRSEGKLSANGSLQVSAISLDEAVEQHSVPLPDLIKMDIEGGELAALQGAVAVLSGSSPIIFLATHGRRTRDECISLLDSLGYEVTPLDGDTTQTEYIARKPGSTRTDSDPLGR